MTTEINKWGQRIEWKPTFHFPDYCPIDKRCGRCYHLLKAELPCTINAMKDRGLTIKEEVNEL